MEGRLSDAVKDLSSKVPETMVLENKLSNMMRLQPKIESVLGKINHMTAIPEPAVQQAKEAETKTILK